MSGPDHGLIGQSQQSVLDRIIEDLAVTTRKIGPAHPSDKKGIAGKKVRSALKTDPAGSMTGSQEYFKVLLTETDQITVTDLFVDRRGSFKTQR